MPVVAEVCDASVEVVVAADVTVVSGTTDVATDDVGPLVGAVDSASVDVVMAVVVATVVDGPSTGSSVLDSHQMVARIPTTTAPIPTVVHLERPSRSRPGREV